MVEKVIQNIDQNVSLDNNSSLEHSLISVGKLTTLGKSIAPWILCTFYVQQGIFIFFPLHDQQQSKQSDTCYYHYMSHFQNKIFWLCVNFVAYKISNNAHIYLLHTV